jgi:hypothetical protein
MLMLSMAGRGGGRKQQSEGVSSKGKLESKINKFTTQQMRTNGSKAWALERP